MSSCQKAYHFASRFPSDVGVRLCLRVAIKQTICASAFEL